MVEEASGSAAVSEAQRRARLHEEVARRVALGADLQTQTDFMAVVLEGPKVNHVLHLLLSIVTAGLWLIVWVLLVLTNKKQRIVITVDEAGEVRTSITTAKAG